MWCCVIGWGVPNIVPSSSGSCSQRSIILQKTWIFRFKPDVLVFVIKYCRFPDRMLRWVGYSLPSACLLSLLPHQHRQGRQRKRFSSWMFRSNKPSWIHISALYCVEITYNLIILSLHLYISSYSIFRHVHNIAKWLIASPCLYVCISVHMEQEHFTWIPSYFYSHISLNFY